MKDFLDEYGSLIISSVGFIIIVGIICSAFMGGSIAQVIMDYLEGAI